MVSFSKNVKKELSEINNLNNKKLNWFELFGYSLTNSSKEFSTESKYNINRYAKLLNNINVDDYKISISGNNFEIKTKKTLEEILENNKEIINEDDNIEKIIRDNKKINDNEKKAIIRGAFLGSGTITDPKRGYHLEIRFKDNESLIFCIKILNDNNIKSNFTNKSKNVLYIEDGDSISNFLAFIGAPNSVLEFEGTRVIKEIRNNVNRQLNLENANLNKTIESSVKQINYIKLIKKKNKFNELSEKERNLAELRLKNPDASLEELRKMLGEDISKSGVSHRMKKIEELGKSLEKKV